MNSFYCKCAALFAVVAAFSAAYVIGAETEWTPEKVAEATRSNTLVFFRESIQRGHPDRPSSNFASSGVLSGQVKGLASPSQNLPSKEAARDGELGLRLNLTIEGDAPAWRLSLTPELVAPYGESSRAWPLFDAYGYRRQGAIEFDLRGDARRKGLGVTLCCIYGRHPAPRLTPLDPYLQDTPDWQHVKVPVADLDFKTPDTALNTASTLLLGGEGWSGALKVDLDNIVLRSDGPEPEPGPVRVDHVGYLPGSTKIGLVAGSRLFGLAGRPFVVRQVNADGAPVGQPVLRGELKLRASFEPQIYGEWVYEADFTPISAQGRYMLDVPGVGTSVPFYVQDCIYDYLFYHLTRFFFFQRVGCNLPEKNAFGWSRPACYTKPEPLASDESRTRVVRHGWIDAGDSRSFPHTDRLGPMMAAWQLSGEKTFDGQLNLPESGNGIPDFLDEMRWQGEYYRDMQLEDGRCMGYLLTGKTGGGSPIAGGEKGWANDPDPRYIRDDRFTYGEHVRITACMALVGRALKPYDAEGAAAFEKAALKAWEWAEANASSAGGGRGGARPGDRLWAATELWRLTRQERFHDVVRSLADADGGWRDNNFSSPVYVAWISYICDPQADPALREKFRSRFVDGVAALFDLVKKEPYGVSVCPHGWYNNPGGVGNIAAQLAIAWKLSGREEFRKLAEEHLHYVFGRNPYRLCSASNVAPESFSDIYNGYEWVPGREVWMPGFIAHMSAWGNANMSRFLARRVRMTRDVWYWGEPCVGFNDGATAAVMLLMDGKHYDDLIQQGAFPGRKPVRPGLPFAPTPVEEPWNNGPVVAGPAS